MGKEKTSYYKIRIIVEVSGTKKEAQEVMTEITNLLQKERKKVPLGIHVSDLSHFSS